MKLAGKVAVVTGGGSGIGRASAELFASEGAMVLVADSDAEAGEDAASSIRNAGHEARFFPVDVSHMIQVTSMVAASVQTYGKLDILFNGAGILAFGAAVETDESTWSRVIAVNLTGTFLCCKAALPLMIERGGGAIVNVSSSTGAHDACARAVAYVASKGGVAMLTKSLAVDYAKDNIRVNAICPGPTDTAMLRRNMTPEQLKTFAASFPMRRLGRADEIAQCALFLASDAASFVTGSLLAVDGGQTAEV